MKLRFWDPPPPPPGPGMLPPGVPLPARRVNLTELEDFCNSMAGVVGRPPGGFVQPMMTAGSPTQPDPIRLVDVEGMLPDQRARVTVFAFADETPGQATGSVREHVALALGNGADVGAGLSQSGSGRTANALPALKVRWEQLGSPRSTWAWLYPASFLLLLILAVVTLVVAWIRRDLTLWVVPLAAGFVWLAFSVGSTQVQRSVSRHRSTRQGLDIDFRLLQRVRLDRAATRRLWAQNLLSGLVGVAITLIVGALTGGDQPPGSP